MSVDSYTGPDVVAVCPDCDAKHNVPDPDIMNSRDRRGHCPSCRSMVMFDYWDGPVIAV